MKNPKVSRRKEIIKIRAEISGIKNKQKKKKKETIVKINKTKSGFYFLGSKITADGD